MTLGNVNKKLAKVNQKLGCREGVTKSRCQLDTKNFLKVVPEGTKKHSKKLNN